MAEEKESEEAEAAEAAEKEDGVVLGGGSTSTSLPRRSPRSFSRGALGNSGKQPSLAGLSQGSGLV